MDSNKPHAFSQLPLRTIVEQIGNETTRKELYAHLRSEREEKESKINAFEQISDTDQMNASGPFNGLPITVKDQIKVADWPRWFGLEKTPKKPDKITAPFVKRLQELGCVVQGKTALPPHALDMQTFNTRRGPTQNPYGKGYTVGGSSGGGAAAVASGMSLLDIGADLAGSLRLPAAWCGVTSLVPTEGKFDNSGMFPKHHKVEHFARMGPIARTAHDLGFFWETLTQETLPEVDGKSLKARIWTPDPMSPIEQHFADLWEELTSSLQEEIQHIERDHMPELFSPETRRIFGEIMGYEASAMVPFFVRWLLRRDKDAISASPAFLGNVYRGYYRDHKRHASNLSQLERMRAEMLKNFDKNDVLIIPVSGITAFRHIAPTREQQGIRTYHISFDTIAGRSPYLDTLTHFTAPISMLGWPVVTLPFGKDKNGIPVGLQLVGKPNGEAKLLSIAIWLEQHISKSLKISFK